MNKTFRITNTLILFLVCLFVVSPISLAKSIEIEVWMSSNVVKEATMREIIADFSVLNPSITVNLFPVPYDEYNEKLAASVPANLGPEIAGAYYGWIPVWKESGFIQPLPEEFTVLFDEEFVPMVEAVKFDDGYYALTQGVRNMALFYNVDLFEEVGLEGPPKTLEEFKEYAIKLTKHDSRGMITQSGYYVDFSEDDHHFWRTVLLMYGVDDHSEDKKTIQWNKGEEAYKAWEYILDFTLKHGVSEPGFFITGSEAFYAGRMAMKPAGWTYTVGGIRSEAPDLNWAVAPLPAGPAGPANMGSYWPWTLTTKASSDPDKYAAAIEFMRYLASEKAIMTWFDGTGELPARSDMLAYPEVREDEAMIPFLDTLDIAKATFWVDEKAERDIILEAYDRAILAGEEPRMVLDEAVEKAQEIRDKYFENN